MGVSIVMEIPANGWVLSGKFPTINIINGGFGMVPPWIGNPQVPRNPWVIVQQRLWYQPGDVKTHGISSGCSANGGPLKDMYVEVGTRTF